MKVLVINGSPKRDRSDCMQVTRAFLRGLGEEAEVLNAIDLNVKPCLGCFGCWAAGAQGCVQKDDMAEVLQKIVSSDLVIWSFPLYCFGMPAPLKAIVDRMIPLGTHEQRVDENGATYHPNRKEHNIRFMMISGCGFPNLDHNYEGALFQFERQFGADFPRILCAESPLLGIAQAKPLADMYLALVEQAGREFKATGEISADTQQKLDTPMYDPDQYRKECSE